MGAARQGMCRYRSSQNQKDDTKKRLDPCSACALYNKYAKENTAGSQGNAFSNCLEPVIDIRQTDQADTS